MTKASAERLAGLLVQRLERAGVDVKTGPLSTAVVQALRERSRTMAEMESLARCYYVDFKEFDEKAAATHLAPSARASLVEIRRELAAVESWTEADTQQAVERAATALGTKLGKVAQPLRVALTGQAASPGIGTTLALVGKRRALERIDRALAFVDARAA
jgi:glutamyl-tRNA synthetase